MVASEKLSIIYGTAQNLVIYLNLKLNLSNLYTAHMLSANSLVHFCGGLLLKVMIWHMLNIVLSKITYCVVLNLSVCVDGDYLLPDNFTTVTNTLEKEQFGLHHVSVIKMLPANTCTV